MKKEKILEWIEKSVNELTAERDDNEAEFKNGNNPE